MCEVTRKNFEEIYPQIIDDLQMASFISVDCEFSGLFDDDNKCSLFDGPKTRFSKLQNSLKNLIIVQLGLSTFKYERRNNKFVAASYTFYLMPTTILANSKFTCQVGSIEFLCKHGFDFNKLFYSGINYFNKSSEARLLRMIEDGNLVSPENEEEVQKYCSRIAEWSGGVPNGSEMVLELNEEGPFVYLLHQEIRKRFPNVWTYLGKPGVVRIRKVQLSEKRELLLNKDEDINLKKKLFYSILGFSRVIKELEKLRKPIIGHNFIIDLIMIYKQFYNPSSLSYKEFKRNITNIFPNVYDTKTISSELREILSKEDTWFSSKLSDLYYYLKNGRGASLVIFTPLINHRNEEYLTKESFHEAGFDSYCTGFCFLKMAYIFSLWNKEKKSFHLTSIPTSITWLLGSVEPMKNKVNLTRAQVDHIVLNGKDPRSVRPGLLFIQSKTSQALDISQISKSIAKHASVDIQLLNKHSGLMAVATRKQANEILRYFQNHSEVAVTKYNFLNHSSSGRIIASSAVIASFMVLAIGILKGWHKGF